MKLNCKALQFYIYPGEIFTFPDRSGLPLLFDVKRTDQPDLAAMDVVGENAG